MLTTISKNSSFTGYPGQQIKSTNSNISRPEPSEGRSGDIDRVNISREAKAIDQVYSEKEKNLEDRYFQESRQLEREYLQEKEKLEQELNQKKQSLGVSIFA
ncbi:MAG: hypothetical protein HUN05_20590 [Desulfobacter sp.]|nr:MAG: hypothetical protein HUN05_20590 [Desulfobacter sp.]